MAKNKSKKKTTTGRRRRRRVSGVGNVEPQTLLLAGAGAFVANKLKTYLTKDPTKTTMVNLAPYAALGASVALSMFVKNPMVKPIALGMGAAGLIDVLKKLMPSAVGNLDTVPIINGSTNKYRGLPTTVNGLKNGGVGYTLPNSSVYRDSMSVVNGVGNYNPNGSGSAYPG